MDFVGFFGLRMSYTSHNVKDIFVEVLVFVEN
jgi:hypothetical protein